MAAGAMIGSAVLGAVSTRQAAKEQANATRGAARSQLQLQRRQLQIQEDLLEEFAPVRKLARDQLQRLARDVNVGRDGQLSDEVRQSNKILARSGNSRSGVRNDQVLRAVERSGDRRFKRGARLAELASGQGQQGTQLALSLQGGINQTGSNLASLQLNQGNIAASEASGFGKIGQDLLGGLGASGFFGGGQQLTSVGGGQSVDSHGLLFGSN